MVVSGSTRRRIPSPHLLALAAALVLAASDPGPAPAADGSFRFAVIPAFSYGSDVGATLGAATFVYRPTQIPGRHDLLLMSASYATRGPRALQLNLESPRLHGDWGGRIDVRVADDNQDPYWGEGGALGGSTVPPGAGSAPSPYRFHGRRAFLAATARPTSAASPSPYARVRLLALDVHDPGALLGAAQPLGSRGGSSLLWEAGLLVDTRDRDVGTRRGLHASASGFAAPAFGPIGPGSFGGGNVTASLFWPLADGATLAVRALAEAKLGDVPFYERSYYEGVLYGGGLGGAGTVRGLARLRMPGDYKALATAELRTTLLQGRPVAGKLLQLGIGAGLDAAYARQRGHPALTALGGFAGLRALWDGAVLLRFEVGYAGQGAAAMYLVTGEQF